MSLDLNASIVAGNSYTISFWADAVLYTSFQDGKIEVGISNSNSDFGTLVYTSETIPHTLDYTKYTGTFVAPSNANYLTTQPLEDNANDRTWIHIDQIELTGTGGSLPVELVHFDLNKTKEAVQLEWITRLERNNFGFEIQRSYDNSHWENIGFVEGSGNTNDRMEYSFVDLHPVEGIIYYRLKQIDFDGSFEHLPVRSIRWLKSNEEKLTVYPNPYSTNFEIKGIDQKSIKKILLVNNQGTVLFSGNKIQQLQSISTNLGSGQYYLMITTLSDQHRIKLVKH